MPHEIFTPRILEKNYSLGKYLKVYIEIENSPIQDNIENESLK